MITCFTCAGYNRFARSLIRFCGMKRVEALTFANLCARANCDAFYAVSDADRVAELTGISPDLWDTSIPYQTEVQLYKSMQAMMDNLGDERNETASHLNALLNDITDRFWLSYSVDIEDCCTVYALCEGTLEPSVEPAVCLLNDWDALNGGAV